jgi:hypothetical protein
MIDRLATAANVVALGGDSYRLKTATWAATQTKTGQHQDRGGPTFSQQIGPLFGRH